MFPCLLNFINMKYVYKKKFVGFLESLVKFKISIFRKKVLFQVIFITTIHPDLHMHSKKITLHITMMRIFSSSSIFISYEQL